MPLTRLALYIAWRSTSPSSASGSMADNNRRSAASCSRASASAWATVTDSKRNGVPTAANSSQIFNDHQVEFLTINPVFQLQQFGAIEILTASLALDILKLHLAAVMLTDVALAEGNLVIETAFILLIGANPSHNQRLQVTTSTRREWRIQGENIESDHA